MYSKEEASKKRQQFWTSFGRYMAPVQSAFGEKVNWINYKTGVKGVRLFMDVVDKKAVVGIALSGNEATIEKFKNITELLESQFPKSFFWSEHSFLASLQDVNIMNEADWPALISFFKENIIALDKFWSENKELFQMHS